jgi:carboxylate-amine ligase
LLRMLYRLRRKNQRWRIYPATLVAENRWLAQRFGVEGSLIDLGIPGQVKTSELIEEIIELVREDAEALGCLNEVLHARTILSRGTSAERQLATYHQARKDGMENRKALNAVVDQVLQETTTGLN